MRDVDLWVSDRIRGCSVPRSQNRLVIATRLPKAGTLPGPQSCLELDMDELNIDNVVTSHCFQKAVRCL